MADPVKKAAAGGMTVIDRMKDHYARNRCTRIEVKQWADDTGAPLVIMADRLTVADQNRLERLKARFTDLELLVEVLIRWARDENGEALFTVEDKHALMHHVDAEVLAGVVQRICNPDNFDDLKKS